jgi:acetyl esterase/lipase
MFAALLTLLLYGSLLRAEEPKIEVRKAPENSEAPVIPPDLDYFANQVFCIPDKDTKLMADLLLPKTSKGPFPTVIFLHGGGWMIGSRKTNLPLMIKLAQEGYASVSVEYRLAPKYPFPAAVHDVKCAVRWLRANARVFNLDADRFAALGYSSGGHLACLLGLTTPLDGLEGEGGFPTFSSRVQVAVSYYGISDLGEWYKDGNLFARLSVKKFLGDEPDKAAELCARANPISYARRDMASVLLVHGTEDTLVPFKQSQQLEKSLKAAGANVRLVSVKAGHNFTDDREKEADAATIKYLDEILRSRDLEKATDRRER